ncbi:uncharacterized protein LOC136078586 [Hydra vulgaris]|uniref:Uncharacterized protein LOC136078586 n=1 Tax=Hydra vulgaris TaxID=6087 RepID=A0ABM4BMX8_HYDVU
MNQDDFTNNYLTPLLDKLNIENILKYNESNPIPSYLDSLVSFSLHPVIILLTRITAKLQTLIDNIFINFNSPDQIYGNLTILISDHMAQFICIPRKTNHPKKIISYRRCFKKFNKSIFINDVSNINWDLYIKKDDDVNQSIKSNKYFIGHNEISNLIKTTLRTGKTFGPNSLPTFLLKLIPDIISKPLSIIINNSFQNGLFPDAFKVAKVIPIFKKGFTMDMSNYRPISLLSNLRKLFEKAIHKRLYAFLNKFKCLYKHQYGFRANHSTTHSLIKIVESIRKAQDDKNFACGVFVDLQKAFDTVDYSILLKKLEYYGIRRIPLKWFTSYLHSRSQFVSVNDSKSTQIKCFKGGQKIIPVNSIKYLGIIIDSNLSFVSHIKDLAIKLSRSNGMLAKLRHYVNLETLLNLYHVIFGSHIRYTCQIWGQSQQQAVLRISHQKKALKIIHFQNYKFNPNVLYLTSKILKLCDLVQFLNCQFVWNHQHKNHRSVTYGYKFIKKPKY